MKNVSPGYEDLFAALKRQKLTGWSVGSFEGGWASDDEIRDLWGSSTFDQAAEDAPLEFPVADAVAGE